MALKRAKAGGVGRPLALVTGASSGIGAAYARALAARGCDLVLVARRGERLEALGAELGAAHGVVAEPLVADLATEAGLAKVERRAAASPAPAWLVHAAGFATRGAFHEVDPAKIRAQLRVHVETAQRLCRVSVPGMLAAGQGSLVLVSSLASFMTSKHYVSYAATKAYLNTLAEGLTIELRGTGLRVQALCPGLTRTGFLETDEYKDFKYDKVPAWAWMSAEAVVAESLAALDRGRGPIVVTGLVNRAFLGAVRAPIFGSALCKLIDYLSRK
ncbi:MAG TPA: SDR family NAD(P)-dependent oxidoreductase [Myxococcota bacterium]|nr:SDR family NAD(P)-dependent oxidoreductase [Myxococcota bacterium]HRY94388.1 SDR family NAD(P)-dependent oxidoreductase [Myxococcota bacterium]HSA19998.1 SDR family NAD(P)-dependent oxidoreductase [Myxococcota bacterium]